MKCFPTWMPKPLHKLGSPSACCKEADSIALMYKIQVNPKPLYSWR